VGGAIVFFHAHPDDEAIFTGGTIARLSADGHRTVVVVATSGELGLLDAVHPGPSQNPLGPVRERETIMASAILGASRVEFLGYSDSGLAAMGEERPDGAFVEADIDEAADRLASILRDEPRVDVRAVIAEKRAAISAHASQIPANADVMTMDDTTFAAVYGYEWYVRRGPAGVIDAISM